MGQRWPATILRVARGYLQIFVWFLSRKRIAIKNRVELATFLYDSIKELEISRSLAHSVYERVCPLLSSQGFNLSPPSKDYSHLCLNIECVQRS